MDIVQFVNQQEQMFTPVIAENSVKWEKESQFAIQLLSFSYSVLFVVVHQLGLHADAGA